MKRYLLKPMLAFLLVLTGGMNVMALETYDFQDLCMALGKGGPWAVNDGGDAGFTLGTEETPITMHFLGDYTEQGFSWNGRFAYEYVDGRGKFTMRNKSNKKDKNCGMFSWDYTHSFSILGLKDGDKVTITTLAGTTSFVSTNVTAEVNEGDIVESGIAYTIVTTEETTRLDISMAAATLISKIEIEPYGVETVPVITVTPKTLKLIPTATAQLKADVSPAAESKWASSDESVATVAEDGTVTAIAAGTATITNSWKSTISDAMAFDKCEITVADVDLSTYSKKTIDFTAMGDITLEINTENVAGAFWNDANSKNNDAYWCANEGLDFLAVQAAADPSGKGWSIVDGQGLVLGTGAGRCAAISGIKKGQIVEFIYTGNGFFTKSDGTSDAGIAKTALNEGVGRAIYLAEEAGMIGFELIKGNAVQQIKIYGEGEAEVTNKTIGLIPGVWDVDGATFAAYAWNDKGNTWIPFVKVGDAYGTQIPDNFTGIVLTRINPAGTDPDPWKNVWNQTDDIDFTKVADQTVFTITGWGEGEGANSTYTTGTVPTDLTELKAALEDAITEATALNAYANDETLTNAITAAQAALANEESTAEDLALVATALKIAATNAAKDVLQKAVTLAGTFGIDASAAQAVLDKEDATIEELKTALTTFLETAIPAAKEALAQAKSFFNTFDKTAAEELKGDFDAAEAALAGTDINAMITAAQTLMYDAMPAAQKALEKVFKYVALIDDATLNADAAAIQTAMAASDLRGMIDAANKMKEDFPEAVQGYVKKAEDLATAGETNGKKGVDELKAAISTAKSAIVTATINKDIVAMGEAIRNLVLAVEAYKQANIFYTVAGTKDLTGTENDFDVVEANNMTIDTETGLYIWTAENITVTADVNPAFKVVKTDLEGQTWYPEGDESTNWVINPAVTGEEGVFTIIITFNAETNYIGVDTKKAGAPENIAIYPTGGDIAAALEEAKAKVAKVGDITINLAVDGVYTLGATLTAPNSIFVYGNEATVTVDEEMTDNFITLDGTETFAMKSETEASDHKLIQSVEIRGLNLKGLKGALVKDAQKTLVEDLAIDWSNIEMPAAGKNVLDFNGKGYVGKVTVTNSTIWANGMNTGFFAQYGSRPKNINGDWLQEFDIENSTIVNIANGKNVCDVKQNGTAQNVYTLKNNIFVDCGKQNQVVVGFNKGQTSATPVWDVEGNYFAWGGACVNAAETEKTGQKDEEDIVKNSVDGTLIFTDAANGDFNGEFELAEGAEAPAALGAPYWTITFKAAPAAPAYYLVGNMTNWVEDGLKEEYKLTKNDKAEEGIEEYMITLNLTTESQFKIAKQDGELFVYYPDGTGNAYGENGEIVADGEYTVYFRPNADGGEDWFYKVIYVASTTTGISYVTIDTENAVIYNLSGQRVTKAQKGLFIVNGKKVVLK